MASRSSRENDFFIAGRTIFKYIYPFDPRRGGHGWGVKRRGRVGLRVRRRLRASRFVKLPLSQSLADDRSIAIGNQRRPAACSAWRYCRTWAACSLRLAEKRLWPLSSETK